ncbi:MAG: IS66 family insertion sequence element accessory protein TnpB [Gammaproteobacteria bacterium]|nr:IS66 family insertion sequence element accessory protein TnpB [Gammaproteobacteria bacterium]
MGCGSYCARSRPICVNPTTRCRRWPGTRWADTLSGALFIFVNRRRTQLKCLYFDRTGYCIWSKRLEAGQFQVDWDSTGKRTIDLMTLRLIVEGLSRERFEQRRRYRRPAMPATLHQAVDKPRKKSAWQPDNACANERELA